MALVFHWYYEWKPSPPSAEAWRALTDKESAARFGRFFARRVLTKNLPFHLWFVAAGAIGAALLKAGANGIVGFLAVGAVIWLLPTAISLFSLAMAFADTHINWYRLVRAARSNPSHDAFLRYVIQRKLVSLDRARPFIERLAEERGERPGRAPLDLILDVIRSTPELQEGWPELPSPMIRY